MTESNTQRGWEAGTRAVIESNVFALNGGSVARSKCINNICAHIESLVATELTKAREEGIRIVGKWHVLDQPSEQITRCNFCGRFKTEIRGKYPGDKDRYICAQCSREGLEGILEGCNNRDANKSKDLLTIISE